MASTPPRWRGSAPRASSDDGQGVDHAIYFELWDTDTRNLLYDFDTEEESLDAAAELIELNPSIYPERMALARGNDDGTTFWLASGASLSERIALHRAHPEAGEAAYVR